jgi:hypothetical protein
MPFTAHQSPEKVDNFSRTAGPKSFRTSELPDPELVALRHALWIESMGRIEE